MGRATAGPDSWCVVAGCGLAAGAVATCRIKRTRVALVRFITLQVGGWGGGGDLPVCWPGRANAGLCLRVFKVTVCGSSNRMLVKCGAVLALPMDTKMARLAGLAPSCGMGGILRRQLPVTMDADPRPCAPKGGDALGMRTQGSTKASQGQHPRQHQGTTQGPKASPRAAPKASRAHASSWCAARAAGPGKASRAGGGARPSGR